MMGMVYAVCARGGRLSAAAKLAGATSAGTTHLHGVHGVGADPEPQGCIPDTYLGVQGEEAGGAGALLRGLEDGVAILVVTGADGGGVEAPCEVPLLLRERAGDLELLIDDLGWGGHRDGQHPAPMPPALAARASSTPGAPVGSPLQGTLCRWCPAVMLANGLPLRGWAVGRQHVEGPRVWFPPGTLSLPLSPALSSFSRK